SLSSRPRHIEDRVDRFVSADVDLTRLSHPAEPVVIPCREWLFEKRDPEVAHGAQRPPARCEVPQSVHIDDQTDLFADGVAHRFDAAQIVRDLVPSYVELQVAIAKGELLEGGLGHLFRRRPTNGTVHLHAVPEGAAEEHGRGYSEGLAGEVAQ